MDVAGRHLRVSRVDRSVLVRVRRTLQQQQRVPSFLAVLPEAVWLRPLDRSENLRRDAISGCGAVLLPDPG